MLDVANNTPKVVWESHGVKSVLRNEWQTSIEIDGYLYGFDNAGAASPITHLNCVNAKNGEKLWQETRFGKGNMTLADGKAWISNIKGELILAALSPAGYQELGRQTVQEFSRPAPSIAHGRLYLRDDNHVLCFDIRAESY